MGTKHLITVFLGGEYKVAQLGMLDGYPEENGLKVLQFLRGKMYYFQHEWENPFRTCTFFTDEELARIPPEDVSLYPQLWGSLSATVLPLVWSAPPQGAKLRNDLPFARHGLACEWAYVIDFDTETFEVHKSMENVPPVGRFSGDVSDASEGYVVCLLRTYAFDRLPTDEEFLEDLRAETA